MEIDRNKTPISHLDLDSFSFLPCQTERLRKVWLEYTVEGARVDIGFNSLPLPLMAESKRNEGRAPACNDGIVVF
jgi:hypothetical protein